MSRKFVSGFGVNVLVIHLKEPMIALSVRRMQELGIHWIRLEFDFFEKINWPVVDAFIDECKLAKIEILGLLNGGVPGTLTNVYWPHWRFTAIYDQQQAFWDFCLTVVNRYSKIIDHWEVLNEPNIRRFWVREPSPHEYAHVLQGTSAKIKQAQPEATIVLAGLSCVGMTGQKADIVDYYRKVHMASGEFFDVANFHPYGISCYFSWDSVTTYKDYYGRFIQSLVANVKETSDKPVWFTEFGISRMWVRLSQQEIAMVYKQCLDICSGLGSHLFLWGLQDMPMDRYSRLNPEIGFGLLKADLEPNDTYRYLQKLL